MLRKYLAKPRLVLPCVLLSLACGANANAAAAPDASPALVELVQRHAEARSFAMRASYVAQLKEGKWTPVSAQYTGIRPQK